MLTVTTLLAIVFLLLAGLLLASLLARASRDGTDLSNYISNLRLSDERRLDDFKYD